MKTLVFTCVVLVASVCHANPHGIQLAPGEQLVSVNGVAVGQHPFHSPGAVRRNSDQARAQQEANEMARRGYCGHVGGTIGSFEGVGCSSGGNIPTCTPRRAMRLTADARACNGRMCYRVRAWR